MVDAGELEALGRSLAQRHSEPAEPKPELSVVNYAESPRVGDWSLRSALVRLAQPEPQRVAALIELVRRLDAVLRQVTRVLERHTVTCDRGLAAILEPGPGGRSLAEPVDAYPDTRTADLARLARLDPGSFATVLSAYRADAHLESEELLALPLLALVLELDDLAEELAAWADRESLDEVGPPVEAVDETAGRVRARLDELGVPVESGPPGRGRR